MLLRGIFLSLKKITKRDIVVCGFLILFLGVATYIHTNKYVWLQRNVIYKIQIPFALKSIHCSESSPKFLYDLMRYIVQEQGSLNNQISFKDRNGKLYHCESGWEDGFNGKRPITVDSRYRYASVSKVVTSAIVLHLVNKGKISLDQKLLDIIDVPEPKDQRIKKITVAMLLEHSAGFDRFKTPTPMLTMGKKPWCPTKLANLSNVTLDFEPNTQFQYSNVGYCLLGAIVEKVTGQSFREAAEEIYDLKERNIKFIDNDFLADEIQYDYRFEDFYGSFYKNKFDFKDSLSAVGGLAGSAQAMTVLIADMLKEQPFNILNRNKSPCAIYLIAGCYGYALLPFEPNSHLGKDFIVYGKDGYFPGVETDVFVDDKQKILVILRGATVENRQDLHTLRRKAYDALEIN